MRPLLSQSLVAGIGNVFKSEICFACGVNPFRTVSTLSINELSCLASTARKFLLANVAATSSDQIVYLHGASANHRPTDREENLWVYKRRGEPRYRCGAAIESVNRDWMRALRFGARTVGRSRDCCRTKRLVSIIGLLGKIVRLSDANSRIALCGVFDLIVPMQEPLVCPRAAN